jgi:hypothetical protein
MMDEAEPPGDRGSSGGFSLFRQLLDALQYDFASIL